MYNDEKFKELKNDLGSIFEDQIDTVVSKYAKEVEEFTKENIKQYVWELLPTLIADGDISKFGFDKEKDFYSFVDFGSVRNKLRKDFRDDLMNEIMCDLQRENRRQKKALDVITKILKQNSQYSFNGYREAVQELEDIGIDIKNYRQICVSF